MKPQEFDNLKQLFLDYAETFIDSDMEDSPYELKKRHTLRVCQEILELGKELKIGQDELILAQTMALFHDIGRFEQFKTYKTFLDSASENHATLGLKIIESQGMLNFLPFKEKKLITESIGFHNGADLPMDRDDKTLFFMGLLRDADKLDIWQVVIDHYLDPGSCKNNFIELGLKDDKEYSTEAFQAIFQQSIVRSAAVKRLNDFKLMQISWVFDLNFGPTFKRVKERRYVEKIASTMPPCSDLSKALGNVFHHMDTHINDTFQPC